MRRELLSLGISRLGSVNDLLQDCLIDNVSFEFKHQAVCIREPVTWLNIAFVQRTTNMLSAGTWPGSCDISYQLRMNISKLCHLNVFLISVENLICRTFDFFRKIPLIDICITAR